MTREEYLYGIPTLITDKRVSGSNIASIVVPTVSNTTNLPPYYNNSNNKECLQVVFIVPQNEDCSDDFYQLVCNIINDKITLWYQLGYQFGFKCPKSITILQKMSPQILTDPNYYHSDADAFVLSSNLIQDDFENISQTLKTKTNADIFELFEDHNCSRSLFDNFDGRLSLMPIYMSTYKPYREVTEKEAENKETF